MMRKHNLLDIYKASKPSIDYTTFSRIIKKYNQLVIDHVCEGKEWPLPLNMGKIELKTLSRNYSKPRVNWAESLKVKKGLIEEGKTPKGPKNPNGHSWLVFYTDDFYTRIVWNKLNSIDKALKNFRIYHFKPSWTFSRSVAKSLKMNELTELSL